MDRVLSRPLVLPWRWIGIAGYAALNAWLVSVIPPVPGDWGILWQHIPRMLADGTLYAPLELPFIYSPVLAWMLAPILSFGFWPYVALHVASLALVRSVTFAGLMLVSWAFWFDTIGANTMTFVVVAGALAMRGSRWGALAYLGLFLLMPRPIQLPLAVWLLWKDRSLWRPFALMIAVHTVAVLVSGYTVEWIEAMLAYGAAPALNIGPTLLLGAWWPLAGIPLGTWLIWRGHPGWAGLVVTPYLLPQYLMMPLVELRPAMRHGSIRSWRFGRSAHPTTTRTHRSESASS